MTTPSDHDKQDEKLIEELNMTWSKMDRTFTADPAPLPDWTAMVQDSRRTARRKLWRELAALWAIAIPILGMMLLLVTGKQTWFWLFQASATIAAVPYLIGEFKRAAKAAEGV